MIKISDMPEVQIFTFNPFQENTYVLYDETKDCVIIDPGCYEKYEEEQLKKFIDQKGLKVKKLLNTHCHVDHVLGNYFVKNHYNVRLSIHKIEEQILNSVKVYGPSYGFNQYQETSPDEYIAEGDIISFGNTQLETLFVPGHSPGHIAFYHKNSGICIAGDVLFQRSIGRTDLPGGNFETLIHSIHQKMFALPDTTIVFPGHGPTTTIGEEKRENPYCAIV